MNIYRIINIFNSSINIYLKLDSFHIFIESLKESRKYYYDYCNLNNINIKDFDNEYINNINKLEGELLKYYILISNNEDAEKYVVVNDTIKEIYNSVIDIFTNMRQTNEYMFTYKIIIQSSFNINYLTREKVDILIKIYTYFALHNYNNLKNSENLLQQININIHRGFIHRHEIEVIKFNSDAITNLNNYLDSLSYESIYERELDKILNNLPCICLSHILSKKILNCDNNEFVKVD